MRSITHHPVRLQIFPARASQHRSTQDPRPAASRSPLPLALSEDLRLTLAKIAQGQFPQTLEPMELLVAAAGGQLKQIVQQQYNDEGFAICCQAYAEQKFRILEKAVEFLAIGTLGLRERLSSFSTVEKNFLRVIGLWRAAQNDAWFENFCVAFAATTPVEKKALRYVMAKLVDECQSNLQTEPAQPFSLIAESLKSLHALLDHQFALPNEEIFLKQSGDVEAAAFKVSFPIALALGAVTFPVVTTAQPHHFWAASILWGIMSLMVGVPLGMVLTQRKARRAKPADRVLHFSEILKTTFTLVRHRDHLKYALQEFLQAKQAIPQETIEKMVKFEERSRSFIDRGQALLSDHSLSHKNFAAQMQKLMTFSAKEIEPIGEDLGFK